MRRILDETHQEGEALTVYSNIYDLKNDTIHIYNLRNFDEVVLLNLTDEPKKGQRRVELAAFFPSNRWHLIAALRRASRSFAMFRAC